MLKWPHTLFAFSPLQQDVRIKNMGSWSNLANMADRSGTSSARKSAVTNSFEQFRRQAKEKEERVSNCSSSFGGLTY